MKSVSRLVRVFAPDNYNLSITLDRPNRHFSGTVIISGTTPTATDEIRVHANELSIEKVLFDGKPATWSLDVNDEVAIATPGATTGSHSVEITFNGEITDPMNGLYPCYYEENGEKKELLATQFESNYARRAFPCIDEPEAKATFDVTLYTEQDVTVLGNMPVKTQTKNNDSLETTFETTPRMSSYLLAWVVGDLHKKTARTASGVEVNVWATGAQPATSLDFSLDIATRTIDFLDDYFGVPYPLPKSDHVALPDFSAGAMENWGLITYRESALLAEPGVTSLVDKRYVATVVAHELSHQWFGNLVTMKWWNDLWLNESFANMMEYLIIDNLEPEWNVWLDHATTETVSALRRDALDGVQSIQMDVHHPDEIATLFDGSIVYAKGGRLLKMLQSYVGADAFRQGLSSYFEEYAYKNTAAEDLWKHLAQASGKDVGGLMNAWMTQSGFPLIRATADKDTISLQQERFFIGDHTSPKEVTWPIPLHASQATAPDIFDSETIEFTYDSTKPLVLNQSGATHAVVHYDKTLLTSILAHVSELPAIDRLLLLHDQTMLAKAGVIPSVNLIRLLEAYKAEQHDAVWDMLSLTIAELKKFVSQNDAAEKKLRALVGAMAESEFARLGWDAKEGEDEQDTILRHTIISLMLYSERPEVVSEAVRRFNAAPLENLDPDTRASLIGAAVRHRATPELIENLMNAHAKTTNVSLRSDIASGLTSAKDIAIIKQLAEKSTDASFVRPQDFTHWFVWLIRNRDGRDYMWQWTQDNWKWIEKTFKSDASYDAFPRYIAGSLVSKEQLQEYVDFFGPLRDQVALTRNIEVGITELTGKIELLERDGAAVCQALIEQ